MFCSAGTHGNTQVFSLASHDCMCCSCQSHLASVKDEKWSKGHEAGLPRDIQHVPCLFMSTTAFLSPRAVFCVFQSEVLMIEVELMRKFL